MVVSAVTASVLISQGRRTERLAEQLVVENRYNEAYKIVSDTVYKGVLQKVCESASNHYISKGDFCNAYIYSVAAPKPYAGKVIEEAKNELLSSENNASMNKNALTVIHQLDKVEEFDSVIISLSEVCCNNKKFGIAMSLAGEISSTEKRNSISSVIFTDGIKYYMENGLYENVGELIDAFGYHDDVIGELTDYCTSVGISVSSLIEECYNNGGSAAAVILSNYLGNSSADIPVNSEDQSIRRNLKTVYPLLTAEQKRAYHANRFSAYKEAYLIKDGAIEGTFITGAVSVDAGEYQSAVLDSKGNVIPIENNGHNLVIPIPEQGNTVQVAVGQKHIVLLENDGTVRAYGDNSYGQCDTAEWTDIVSVAAGASFTVGLRTDGTLVACGSNMCSQCDVSDYGGIVDIDALDQTVVILFADGTVGLQGDVTLGIKDASLFKNVRRISAGDACIVAETSDGKYLMASGYAIGSCGSVADWQNYEMFCAGSVFAAAVDADGNIIYTGDGAPKH